MRAVAHFICIIAAAATMASASAADAWKMIQSVGDVQVSAPGIATPIAVKPADPLPDGATVTTGSTGRAVLLRGRETIVMSPSSRVTLPNGTDLPVSQVRQHSGTLLFKIGKKPEAHFEVDTPYLAAVVKGTTFTVNVRAASASVHVLEGAVEVATKDHSQSFLTRAGQISSVFAQSAHDIFTTGTWNNAIETDGDAFDMNGASIELPSVAGAVDYGHTRVFSETGLRAAPSATNNETEVTERAIVKMMSAFQAVEATLASSQDARATVKPSDGSVIIASDRSQSMRYSAQGTAHQDDAVKPVAPTPSRIWTVTRVQGSVKVDGEDYSVTGQGLVRTLRAGTRVDTGADGRLAVSYGRSEFAIEPNSSVILSDVEDGDAPLVMSGRATERSSATSPARVVRNLSTEDIATILSQNQNRSRTATSAAPNPAAKTASNDASLGVPRATPVENRKTEEVRTQVIGGVTIGLYALTATLLLAISTRWAWRRYRSKKEEPEPETAAQARLRTIKEA